MWDIEPGRIVSGADISRMTPDEFSRVVQESDVFVKIAPAQKERIVQELRKQGHVVGFMGDGINDAPALKEADVGISVRLSRGRCQGSGGHRASGKKPSGP